MRKGFTLIELMIVIAIMGILAAAAFPMFGERIARGQLNEAMSFADELKPRLVEYYRAHGRFPKDNAEAGLPAATAMVGNYVQRVDIVDGAIHITMHGTRINPGLAGKVLSVRPQLSQGAPKAPVTWNCGNPPRAGLKVVGESRTNIAPRLLPLACG